MNKRLERLEPKAIAAGAYENWKDAMHDLLYWTDLHKQILDDLENAIKAHKQIRENEKSQRKEC